MSAGPKCPRCLCLLLSSGRCAKCPPPVLEVIEAAADTVSGFRTADDNTDRPEAVALRQARNRVSALIRAARSVTATGDDRTLRMAIEELRAALAGVL